MILALLACSEPAPERFDDVLSLANAQVVGTHNSYHVSGEGDWGPFEYDHLPLNEQMGLGVRQYELDVHWIDDAWVVVHDPVFDPGVTCGSLPSCFAALSQGSIANPDHLPVMVLLELKATFREETGPDQLDSLIADIEAGLPQGILEPESVQGDAATMREAMEQGWPPLFGQRDQVILVLHEGGSWGQAAREMQLPHLFFDAYGDVDADWAAIHSINDPYDPRIPEVVALGHLVRTRADSGTVEARENDTSRRDQALASGAQFISTDFPSPHPDTGYVVDFERVARCNPVNTHELCSPEALE